MTTLPDYLKPGLTILFVGINPGRRSAELGHHFAGHSNRFWRFLADAGLTPVKLSPLEDFRLVEFGYGITNIVPRMTPTAAELSPTELKAGAAVLREKIQFFQPKIVAYLGKTIYQHISKSSQFEWGYQPTSVVNNVLDFVLPNPSGLNRMPIPEQLKYYQDLHLLTLTDHSPQ